MDAKRYLLGDLTVFESGCLQANDQLAINPLKETKANNRTVKNRRIYAKHRH